MPSPSKNYLLKAGLAAVITISGATIPGCNDFFNTDQIKIDAQKIVEDANDLRNIFSQYSGITVQDHPPRSANNTLVREPDNTYTLYYQVDFTDVALLEKLLKEQLQDPNNPTKSDIKVSTDLDNHKMAIAMKDNTKLSKLGDLLHQFDRMPQQVWFDFGIYLEYGNKTQDLASKVGLRLSSEGREFAAGTLDSILPGQSTRVSARADMGSRWGAEVNTDVFHMIAILDTLRAYGVVKQVVKTGMRLADGQKGVLSGEEKLPIDAYILADRVPVHTYNLVDVKSIAEITPTIYPNGSVKVSLRAGVGSAKRPEARVKFLVPVYDEVQIPNIHLLPNQPYLIAGKVNRMNIRYTKEDAILPFLKSKDSEDLTTRTWYTLTVTGVDQVDYSALQKPTWKTETRQPN